ncbi:hypothetical protein [Salinibacter altiplanensis]|uniref:hypothetical protein n=1 Tax=Salinibacter altiplanensis TaxID=1803181 RepID=UPI000C9FBE24|nr:hypothetical protein [Salinibacter altiplanensis]
MQTDSKWSFILVRGVFFWGYPTGLIGKSIELSPPGLHLPRFGSGTEVAIFLTIWTIAGAAFGAWMWHRRSTEDPVHETTVDPS